LTADNICGYAGNDILSCFNRDLAHTVAGQDQVDIIAQVNAIERHHGTILPYHGPGRTEAFPVFIAGYQAGHQEAEAYRNKRNPEKDVI
jgi:hypothetical protein